MRNFVLTTCFLAFFSVFGMNAGYAQKAKKYSAKVYTLNNRTYQGILQSVNENGLYLKRSSRDTATFVSVNQIRQIKLRRKGKTSTGTTIGFLTGLAAGTAAVVALHNDDKLENTIRIVGAAVFTFATTAIGGAIASRPDEVIKIYGRTEDYLQVLGHLKSLSLQPGN
jgi:hypothetical protein